MKKVTSLQEYVSEVERISKRLGLLHKTTTHPWFRGQSDSSWKLVPKLYRSKEDSKYEREMFRDFKLRATAFLPQPVTSDMEWLFLMQHYGMPTRLLDWTESHLIALYFAVLDYQTTTDACVWVLDPWSLNEYTMDHATVPTGDHKIFKEYSLKLDRASVPRRVTGKLPVAVRPVQNTPRIIAQKGTFVVFGNRKESLNSIASKIRAKKPLFRLARITIDASRKECLLRQLILAGISHSVLFPELDGLSKEISFRYSGTYMNHVSC